MVLYLQQDNVEEFIEEKIKEVIEGKNYLSELGELEKQQEIIHTRIETLTYGLEALKKNSEILSCTSTPDFVVKTDQKKTESLLIGSYGNIEKMEKVINVYN